MRQLTGVVTFAQEGRFHLVDDQGRHVLFVLSHRAAIEPQDLFVLARGQARVSVACEPATGVAALVAHEVVKVADAAAH